MVKWQVINLIICCIWLVHSIESMMMQGLANPKFNFVMSVRPFRMYHCRSHRPHCREIRFQGHFMKICPNLVRTRQKRQVLLHEDVRRVSYWRRQDFATNALVCNVQYFYNVNSVSGTGSSVGIPTGYELDGPGIESRWGRDFQHLSRPALGPT